MGNQLAVGAGEAKSPLRGVLDNFAALMEPGTQCNKRKLLKLSYKIWPKYFLGPTLPKWPREGSIGVPLQHLERYLWCNERETELPYLYLFYNLGSDEAICQMVGIDPSFVPRLGKRAALNPPVPTCSPAPKVLYGGVASAPMAPAEEDDFPPPYVPQPPIPPEVANQPLPSPPPIVEAEAPTAPALPASSPPALESVTPPRSQATPERSPVQAGTPRLTLAPFPDLRRSERERKSPDRFSFEDPGTSAGATGHYPLRQVPGPTGLVFIHTPFTTTDLHSWKQGLPPYRESPQQYVDLVTRIMSTHRPDIPDLFTLLSALLNEEEKRQVLAKAYEAFNAWRLEQIQGQDRGGGNGPAPPLIPLAEEVLCLNPPPLTNDPNTEFGRLVMQGARQAVKEGLQKGVPRVINYQKVYNTVQRPEESPSEFLTRLKDAYRRHTDVDPEDPGNLAAIRGTFISQSAPDVRKKIQKLATPSAQPLETLVQTAFQVFYQRPEAEEAQADVKMKKKANLLAAALQPYWNGPPHPGESRERALKPGGSCFICGSADHWVRDCPHRPLFRHWEPHDPLPRGPDPRGQPHGRGGRGGSRSVPLAQGDRYPCEVRRGPHPGPQSVMAAAEGEQY